MKKRLYFLILFTFTKLVYTACHQSSTLKTAVGLEIQQVLTESDMRKTPPEARKVRALPSISPRGKRIPPLSQEIVQRQRSKSFTALENRFSTAHSQKTISFSARDENGEVETEFGFPLSPRIKSPSAPDLSLALAFDPELFSTTQQAVILHIKELQKVVLTTSLEGHKTMTQSELLERLTATIGIINGITRDLQKLNQTK